MPSGCWSKASAGSIGARTVTRTGGRAELQDEARDLRRRALVSWRSAKDVAGFGLGITGAAWALAAGSPVRAALTARGAGLRMLPSNANGSAYSYSNAARRHW